MSTEVF
jgi:hypothetical protein